MKTSEINLKMMRYEDLDGFELPIVGDLTHDKVANYIRQIHGRTDADTFFLYGGVGDPILWLSVLAAYKEKSKISLNLSVPQASKAIPLMYKNRSFNKLLISDNFIDNEKFQTKTCDLKSNERIAHHMYYGDKKFHNYTGLCCASGLTNLDMVKSILGLDLDAKPVSPMPLPSAILEAAKLFQAMNLEPGKTVLIAPLAKSYPHQLPVNWWEPVVSSLMSEGFKVVTNIAAKSNFSSADVRDKVDFIKGSIPLEIPIDLVIPFTELCGNFIGVRSGLCDLLAFSNARKIIIYPQPDPEHKNYSWIRSTAYYWSLKRNFHSERTNEYLVGDSDGFDQRIILDLLSDL